MDGRQLEGLQALLTKAWLSCRSILTQQMGSKTLARHTGSWKVWTVFQTVCWQLLKYGPLESKNVPFRSRSIKILVECVYDLNYHKVALVFVYGQLGRLEHHEHLLVRSEPGGQDDHIAPGKNIIFRELFIVNVVLVDHD